MRSLRTKLQPFVNNIEVFGVLSTLRSILAGLLAPRQESGRFDRRYQTDTSAFLSNEDGKIPLDLERQVVRYEPVAEEVVQGILRRLPVDPRKAVFIDVGCGKGRVLLQASRLPFARVIGIELSPVSAEIARRNAGVFARTASGERRCEQLDVWTGNVLDMEFPDANIVFFLYNPFQGPMFESFARHVHRFSVTHPTRDVLLAYCNPWFCGPWLESSGYFRKIYEQRVILPKWSWSLWTPAPATDAQTGVPVPE
jgi:SAM-dependent methyltransferase